MEKSLEALGQVLRASPALQAQLKSAANQQEYIQRAVQIGKENGVEVNRAALEAAIQQTPAPSGAGGELSVDQLESVAGGRMSDGFLCKANYALFTSGYLKC